MTGSLRIKRGIWQMVFSYKDSTGKWRTKSESTGLKEKGNKRRAAAMLDARLKELSHTSDKLLQNSKVMFLDAMEQWLEDVMIGQVRYNTLVQYKNAFAYNIKSYPPFQNVRLQKLTPALLQSFYNAKVKAGLSPNTVHKLHANLNKFLNYAVAMDMIPSNPAQRVTLPRKVRPNVGKAYTAQQLQELLHLLKGDPLELVVFLTVTYGLRRSEVCGLRWSSVDFKSKHLRIDHTAVAINGQVIRANQTKSAASCRTLPMSPQVCKALEAEWAAQETAARTLGILWKDSGYVCVRPDGLPLDPTFVSHHFARVIKKSGLPYIRFHDLRHSAATLLHSGGYDLKDIQGWLGHSDISTTGNIYSHLEEKRLTDIAQTMGRTLLADD